MGDWVSAHLDVSSQTANRLWQLARAGNERIDGLMAGGRCGLDRAAVLAKLHAADVNEHQLGDATATRFSLGRLYGLLERVRSFTADEERTGFEHRYLVIQPSLDDAAYKLWGLLPGVDGQVISAALDRRETELPVLPGAGNGQGQRRADALTAICLDTLTDSTNREGTAREVTVAEVFIDAGVASRRRWGIRCHPAIRGQGRTQHPGGDPLRRESPGDRHRRAPPHRLHRPHRRDTPGGPPVRAMAGHGSMLHCRLPQPIPDPTPPHPRTPPRRQPPPGQPGVPVLVPPPRRHPPTRLHHRPAITHPSTTAPLPPPTHRATPPRPARPYPLSRRRLTARDPGCRPPVGSTARITSDGQSTGWK